MPEFRNTGMVMQHLALVALACIAIAAFGAAYDQPIVWSFCMPCVLSVFWRIRSAPRWLRVTTQTVAYGLLLLTTGLGFLFMAYPILSQQVATHLSLTVGYGLSILAALFLIGRVPWPPASSFFPVALGLLVVDCFNPDARIRNLLAGAGVVVFVYLSLASVRDGNLDREIDRNDRNINRNRGNRNTRTSISRWPRLAAFAALASLIAAAGIVLAPQLQSVTEKLHFEFAQSHMLAYSGLSDTTLLGDLEELKLSSRVVMRVWTDRPQNLRARAYTSFNGREWRVNPGISRPLEMVSETKPDPALDTWNNSIPGNTFLLPGTDSSHIYGSYIRTRIIQKLFNNGMMVSPGNKLLVRADLPNLRIDFGENLQPLSGENVETYGTVSRNEDDVIQPGPTSAEELSNALQIPADTDPRIRVLAQRLADATSPEEKLKNTIGYLQGEYHYSLNVGSFHTAQPIAEFLFEKKQGYCQYFAGSAALLLRVEGVPTRYVSGFHVTEDDRSDDHYVVREMNAHAWIEAYIPGRGWVEADPTPAAEYQSLHAGLSRSWFARLSEWIQARFAELSIHFTSGDWQSGLRWVWTNVKAGARWCFSLQGAICIITALLLGGMFRWLRLGKRAHGRERKQHPVQFIEPAPELAQMLKRLDACWARKGLVRPAHRTPLEHLKAIPVETLPLELRTGPRNVIEAYYRASFGGEGLSEVEMRALLNACDLFERDTTKR